MDQVVVERECDAEADSERDQRDGEPRAQLTKMFDERRLLAVAEATRNPPHCLGGGSSSGSSSPVTSRTEFLNSRMPRPSDFPNSGSRFGPKTSRTTTSRMRISQGPIQPGI